MVKYTPAEAIAHFWAKIDRKADADACWIWIGGKNGKGYGSVGWKGKIASAHRVAYELTYGVDPGELLVLHKCDNPPCCNPRHLFLGTDLDNARDREAKGRGNQPKGERQGLAKLTQQQVDEIRRLYAAGGIFQYELGNMFGVTQGLIGCIVRGEIWRG